MFNFKTHLAPDLDTYEERPFPVHVLLHRLGLGTTAKDAVLAFTGGPRAVADAAASTGGKFPYSFVVEADGTVVQTLPLDVKGPHAYRKNPVTLGIAALGDFRVNAPSQAQFWATAQLVRLLEEDSSSVLGTFAHDVMEGASSDPSKECPGRKWDLVRFFDIVDNMVHLGGLSATFWHNVVRTTPDRM